MPYGLYPPMPRSPVTYLTNGIDDSITTIKVDDITKLPTAPNIATIGEKENSETIQYEGTSGSNLVNVTRGFEGEAREWNKGTPIANVPCAQHVRALQGAVKDIQDDIESVIDEAREALLDENIMRKNEDQAMGAKLVAQDNTDYTTRQVRNVILSTANPTGGENGDIWIKYA